MEVINKWLDVKSDKRDGMLDESQFTMLDGEIPDGEMPYEEFEKIVLDY